MDLPGKTYLVNIGRVSPSQFPLAEKCIHKNGQWVVPHEGQVWAFSPPTQLQKDIWLNSERPTKQESLRRQSMLHWLCHNCRTIQTP